MKRTITHSLTLFTLLVSLSSFNITTEPEIVGMWVRKSDNLRIKISAHNEHILESFIIEEGKEKFPCEVSQMPIYKNIIKAGRNLWYCDFLVVTIGNCATNYESGIIQLMKNGDLEITCPGFEKKIYAKAKPRLEKQ
ncbi:hypothetical protein [Pseudochryseolinea flava]|uniref:DUF2147 domain-containing protein n=1 Tax=Pseudochryseolinea flava TaxID=2059302 RepID=A0A364Y763_9BACT|nr:hypothetical protein [Pseudochryseolinea flava]RAW02946.1 hypothetical protein DQQ10_02240 [Pseudochryseolinea flava]